MPYKVNPISGQIDYYEVSKIDNISFGTLFNTDIIYYDSVQQVWKNGTLEDIITITTNGTSGSPTIIGNTINIPSISGASQKRHEYSAPYDYNAFAPQGTLDTDPVWVITRLTINADGTFIKGTALGAWSNRVNLTYI